jgi:hypothetical protein
MPISRWPGKTQIISYCPGLEGAVKVPDLVVPGYAISCQMTLSSSFEVKGGLTC